MSSHRLSSMGRPLRLELAGAVYHVMARGNQGRPIFADDLDRQRWLEILGESSHHLLGAQPGGPPASPD